MTIKELNRQIKNIDCGMMITYTLNKELNSRPMLTITDDNEPQKLYFFCMKNSLKIKELTHRHQVALTYQDKVGAVNLHIFGTATITDEQDEMQAHWDKKLNVWWQTEAATEGICMITVRIEKYRYWTNGENGTDEVKFN